MRNRTYMGKAAFTVSLLLVLLSLAGCGKSSQKPDAQQQSVQQQQSQEKEPEKLKNIETRLETLIDTLGGPSVKMEEKQGEKGGGSDQKQQGSQQQGSQQEGSQQQGTQQQGSQQGTQQQGTQQQGSQQGTQQQGTKQQGGQQQSTQQQGTKQQGSQQGQQNKGGQQKGTDKWSEIDTHISNLHYQWNEFMPEIAKKGADMKLVDNFDNALNKLTTTVTTKDSEKILSSANDLYSHIPDLYSLYRSKMSPEAKRMIYYTRNIILEAAKNNWEQVKKDDDSLEKSWNLFRNTLEKEQQQIGDQLNFSIYELNKVVTEKNKQLADIKGRIALSNIKELEKSFEQKK